MGVLKIYTGAAFEDLGGSSGGATNWLDLTDTPSGFGTVEGLLPAVDSANTALELVGHYVQKDTLANGVSFTIDSGYQMLIGSSFTVTGTLTVNGKLVVV